MVQAGKKNQEERVRMKEGRKSGEERFGEGEMDRDCCRRKKVMMGKVR